MIRALRLPVSTSLRCSVEVLEQRIAPAALIGLDDTNHLLAFDSATPGTVVTKTVTGLAPGETLIGIDFRPATGALYGIAKTTAGTGHVYLINPADGVALLSVALTADPTDLTSPFGTLSGTNFGVDFNPVVDLLRVVSDGNQNLRINVDSGFVTTDDPLNPTGSTIAGAAYANSFAGAGATTLYDLDIAGDKLVIQNPPNNGTLTNPLPLGVDAVGVGGFDILSTRDAAGHVTDSGFAALKVGTSTGLYSINLATGAATSVAAIGTGATALRGLTAVIGAPAGQAYTIDSSNNHLVSFNTATPATTVPTDLGAITGLGGGESILGFDFRPSTGLLYLVTKDGSNAGHLYIVNPGNAVATTSPGAGTISGVTFSGTNFGVDFDPTSNALRIVSNVGQNVSVNVDTGGTNLDFAIKGATTGVHDAAYSNNFAGATTTTLYDLNTDTDQLFTQVPGTGDTTLVGALGVDATGVGGFDISTDGHAYATLTVGGVAGLYSINLQTGAATEVGAVNGVAGDTLGLALAPKGAFQFHTPTLTVGEGAGNATLTIDRVGGSEGTSTVLVKTSTGTAGTSDFTTVSKAVTFGPGVTSMNIDIPITQDALIENSESFTVTLSNPAGGAQLDTIQTATVTITDDDPAAGPATSLIGLDSSNHLVFFSSTAPGTITSTKTVAGLGTGESLVGIDFRPATGALYGLTKDAVGAGRLYVINPATGQASFSFLLAADPQDSTDGNASYATLSGSKFGLDFNPAVDRLRVVSDTQQDLRINVDTGLVFTDAALNPAPQVGESAYTNSFAGATGTTLYNIDFGSDRLSVQSPPNTGTQADVGPLGVNTTGFVGFDIVSSRTPTGAVTNTGFATLQVGASTSLYGVDLATGHVGSYGAIGDGTTALIGLTSPTGAPAADAYTIDGSNELVRFSTATPGVETSRIPITGLGANEEAVGFDFRPTNGLAYLVTVNLVDSTGHIYRLDPTSPTPGVATPVSTISVPFGDHRYGVDFDPVEDRLRIVSDTGENLRVNVDDGSATVDTPLNPMFPSVVGAAYTNPFPGGGSVGANTGVTQLYVLDATTDKLYLQSPANNGTLTAVGTGLGIDAQGIGEFDIRANGEAFAVLYIGVSPNLYSINLSTGAATLVGFVPSGQSHGFALAPNVVSEFSAGAVTVPEEGGPAVLTVHRLNGTTGTSSVIVQTHDGTATAGSDFTAFSQVITFGPNEMTKQISIPILNDNVYEGTESFTVTITDQSGNAFNAVTTETVTITDNEAIPTVSIGDVRQVEGNVPNAFSFPVTLSGPAQADVTFDYDTMFGTTNATDFVAATGAHGKILAGQTTGTVTVTVNGDTTFEPDETFTVKLKNLSANATFTDDTALGTIQNDDANSISAKMVTYTDVDGDLVTVKTTVGTLSAGNFTFVPAGTHGGLQLQKLDLSSPTFINSNLTITAQRTAAGGDGFANVGYLNASGNTLGVVSINGDLGQIDANAAKALGLLSLGKLGVSTQGAGGSLQSTIVFNLPTLSIRTDIVDASISALNFTAVTVFGNVVGGIGDHSGSIEASGRIGALTIGGTLHGGTDAESGSVIAKTIGAVKIREIDGGRIFIAGNTVGATATAANNAAALALGSLTVAANVTNANILVGFDRSGAPVNADVKTGAISVGGDWVASNLSAGVKAGTDGFYGSDTGALIGGGGAVIARIASVTVKGQAYGTIANTTDRFGIVSEQIGAFTVGGTKLPLSALATAPKDKLTIGFTDDVLVREY